MNIIQVTNLTKEFKTYNVKNGFWGAVASALSRKATFTKAIDDLNFSIKKGEFVGYVGENGAGKSTTIKILTGILVPTSGEAFVNNLIPYKNREKNASFWWVKNAIQN